MGAGIGGLAATGAATLGGAGTATATGGGYPASWNMLAGDAPAGGMTIGAAPGTVGGAGIGLDSSIAGGALGPEFGGTTAGSWSGNAAAGGGVLGTEAGIGLGSAGMVPMSTAVGNPFTEFLNYLGVTPGQTAATAYNMFTQNQRANQFEDFANQSLQQGQAPINQPQRASYQQDLRNLVSNPNDFFSSNPLFQAQLDQAKKQFEAQYSKQGMGGTQINDYMKNIMNVGAGTYFDQANLLGGLGGFTQGSGSAGSGFGQLAASGVNASSAGAAGFGPIIGSAANSQAGSDVWDSISNLFRPAEPNSISGSNTVFS